MRSFGEFVAGDKIVVGLIIFVIIVVIQFVVITKGATRISEVAARFALDGMPGRQMAIDADLNAGVIDEREAQRRRGEVTEQADFFGAMDGASKFVRGDAIAGIVITLINIIGGLVIGVVEYGMDVGEAASLFTRLTIGDGLVSQVPAFLISLAAGLLVTRSTAEVESAGAVHLTQIFSRPQALAVTAAFLGLLIFTNLPAVPLLGIGGSCAALAVLLDAPRSARPTKPRRPSAAAAAKKPAEAARRRLSGRRSDGNRNRRRPDSPGRSEARRRPARAHPARAAERGRRDGPDHAQGPHPRQHAARTESISHQDRRHAGGRRARSIPACCWRSTRGAATGKIGGTGRARAGVRHAGHLDRAGAARPGRDAGLHGGRAGQRAGHAPDRSRPPPCRRNPHPRRDAST